MVNDDPLSIPPDKYLSAADAAIAKQIHDKVVGIVEPSRTRNSPDVQRGNPHQNDSYFTLFLKFGVRIGAIYESLYNRSVASHMRCPARF